MARKKPDYTKYTPQQLEAAELLADLESKPTNREVADAVGISERQLYRWLADEDFIALVTYRAEISMDLFGVDVYRALLKRVRAGDVKALELALKRMGVLKEVREISSDVRVDVTAIAGRSQEELLAEIAAKEAILLGGDTLNTAETSPNTFEVVTAEPNANDETDDFLDEIIGHRYESDGEAE